MLQGKQSAWIISVYCLLHKVLYGFTSQFTEQASFLVHLYWFPNSLTCSINFIHQPSSALRKRREEELFSLPLRMLCDFDLVTYMIDSPWTVKMIASLMKAHQANLGILSVDVPELTTKMQCEMIAYSCLTVISLSLRRLERLEKRQEKAEPFCISCIIIQSNFQSFSPSPSLPVYISPETHFIPKLKIMPIPFIFSCDSITSKNNEEGEYGDFREKNNV